MLSAKPSNWAKSNLLSTLSLKSEYDLIYFVSSFATLFPINGIPRAAINLSKDTSLDFSIAFRILSTDFTPKPGFLIHSSLYCFNSKISPIELIQPQSINFSIVAF